MINSTADDSVTDYATASVYVGPDECIQELAGDRHASGQFTEAAFVTVS